MNPFLYDTVAQPLPTSPLGAEGLPFTNQHAAVQAPLKRRGGYGARHPRAGMMALVTVAGMGSFSAMALDVNRASQAELQAIKGVGPRTALGILSGMSADELARAVSDQEAGRLTKVPGIGKKTAERLLLELKGKLGADLGPNTSAASGNQSDILQALLALGYSDKEASAALKALPADVGVSDGIKLALKSLAK